MKQTSLTIRANRSGSPEFSKLVISVRSTSPESGCVTVIGYPGSPNVVENMFNGDAALFETVEDGIFEVRAIAVDYSEVEFLITHISPRSGFAAGFIDEDPANLPFSDEERGRISDSIADLKRRLREESKISSEQFDLLGRKLDEIQSASERLGRKDWINYTAGTLTSVCIGASFAPDTTRQIFHAVSAAFAWLFTHAQILLQF